MTVLESLYRSYVWARRRWIRWTWRPRSAPLARGVGVPVGAQNVLVVCTGLIGDTVMCTPAMMEARRLFPQARIIGLVNSRNRELLGAAGWFDDLLVYDGSPFPLRRSKAATLRKLEVEVCDGQFDIAIVLLGGDWTHVLYRVGIPVRVAGDDNCLCFLATHVYTVGEIRRWGPNDRMNALRCLGLRVGSSEPRVVVAGRARDRISSRLANLGFSREKPLVVFHPFGATVNRCLPPAKIARLVTHLVIECEANVALVGGTGALPMWEGARRLFSEGTRGICDLVGQLGLQDLCALIERADVVVSVDSGPMHVAGALRRPTVGLFRAIRPEYARLYETVTPLFWEGGAGCLRGCSWDSWRGCRMAHCRQLAGIADAEIVESVRTLLWRPVALRS